MSTTFALSEQSVGDLLVIAVQGEIDLFTSPQLKERLTAAVAHGHQRLIVDLTDTSFIDSSGLGTLIGAQRRVRERDGQVALVGPNSEISRILELTGLDQVFAIFAGRAEAVAALD